MSNRKLPSLRHRRRVLLLASAALLATPVTAIAADEPVPAAAFAESEDVQDVTVTARRRVESLQKTPVSATVLSGGDAVRLNIRDFQDLRGLVPNLEVTPLNSGGVSVTIRGIGQTSTQVNVDTKAGFYVNDMYVARQEGNGLYFYDVDSTQVLNGPQGQLFGKNTTGGALLLTTKLPDDTIGGYAKLRAGTYHRIDSEGAINVPLSDTLFTRFSWRTQNTDGYIRHVTDDGRSNDINDKSGRFQLRWLPTERLTVDLLAEQNESSTSGTDTILTGCQPDDAYIQNYNALHTVPYCTAYPVLKDPYEVYGGASLSIPTSSIVTEIATGGDANSGGVTRGGHLSAFNDTKVTTLNVRLRYALTDTLSVRSITAYRRSKAGWYNPYVDAPNDIYAELDRTNTTQWSQEFNLNGSGFDDRLNYVVGLYYASQKTDFVQDTGPDWIDPVGYRYAGTNTYQSYAAYSQASFKIVPAVELTLGGRYTHDEKKAASDVFFQTVYVDPCATFVDAFRQGAAVCGGSFTGADKNHWDNFSPRAQLSWQVSPDLFTYASVTRGYNAGGFNQQLGSNVAHGKLISYDPEKLTSYEIGVKSSLFDRRLQLNLAGFYQDYQDIQTTVLVNFNGVLTRQVQTGATAHEQGFEASLTARPVPPLTLNANVAYLDQAYDSVRTGANFTKDTPVNTAPKWTYSLQASYAWSLSSGADITSSLNWRWVDKKPSCNPVGACYLPAYGLLGGRIDLKLSQDSPWRFSLWGTNLLDQVTQLSRSFYTIDAYLPGRPREMGIEVTRTF